MENRIKSYVKTARDTVASQSHCELMPFMCNRVGKLLGFMFEDAIVMAKVWKDHDEIIPTGMDRPLKRGIAVDKDTVVPVNVPIYRLRYVNAKTGEPITYGDMSITELQEALSQRVVKSERFSCDTAVASCYNLWCSKETAIDTGDNFAWRWAADDRVLLPPTVEHDAFKQVLSRLAILIDADRHVIYHTADDVTNLSLAAVKTAADEYLKDCYVGREDATIGKKHVIADVVYAMAALMLRSYIGRQDDDSIVSVHGTAEYTMEQFLCGDKVREFMGKLDDAERYDVYRVAFNAATELAFVWHERRYLYSSNAADNFDIMDELTIEAMADMKFGELQANYLLQRVKQLGGI